MEEKTQKTHGFPWETGVPIFNIDEKSAKNFWNAIKTNYRILNPVIKRKKKNKKNPP